ncbi:MAG: hypothetical protein LBO06_05905 [Bacteroidales bacterium]|jgi:hypothetical protein|nr:hypothetical protein [Bacteroidales bacterium]
MKITIDNYEAFLLDDAEGTLSQQDKVGLDAFLEANPSLAQRAELYDPSLVLIADNDVVYEDKNKLLRQKPKVIYYFWKMTAAAAVFVGLIVGGYFLISDNKTSQPLAVTPKTQHQNIKTQPQSIQTPPQTIQPKPQIKTTKQPTAQPTLPIEEPIEQNIVIHSDNLVVYEVDNLIVYEVEATNLVVYEVDNLITYDTSAITTFIEDRKADWHRIKNNLSNQLMARVAEPMKKLFNI